MAYLVLSFYKTDTKIMIKRQNRQKKSKVLKTECTKTECIERQNDKKTYFLLMTYFL